MQEWLKQYVLTVAGAAVLALIVDVLLPDGSIRRFARFSAALVVSVAILSPFLSLPTLTETISGSSETVFTPDYTEAVTRTVRAMPGYENARVTVFQEKGKIASITIRTGRTLIEDASAALTKQQLIQTLRALYGTELIVTEDGP